MTCQPLRFSLASALMLLATNPADLHGATPIPIWYGSPGTTRQGYEFTTGNVSPAPEILENPFGTPMTTLNLGTLSDGWQDPSNPFDLSGVTQNGAWDLGFGGSITIQLDIADNPPPPGQFFHIDFQVYVVAYRNPSALPTLEAVGLTPQESQLTQTIVAEDPVIPGATWTGLNWTGSFADVAGTNTLTIRIKAPSNNLSVLDTVEIFTRTTLVGGDPYDTWAGLGVPFDGDKNGDGVSNGLAFLLGADNPDDSALGLLPTPSEAGGSLVMRFTCLATADRGTSTLNLEYDGDLAGPWLSVPVPAAVGNPNPIVETTTTGSVRFVATDGGTNTNGDALIDIVATITDATESASRKLFGRLKVVKP